MQEKKKTLLIFTTSILILMVIVLTASLINFIISKTTYYKISPRVKNMEKYLIQMVNHSRHMEYFVIYLRKLEFRRGRSWRSLHLKRRLPRFWSGTSMTQRRKLCLLWCVPRFSRAGAPPTEACRRKNRRSSVRWEKRPDGKRQARSLERTLQRQGCCTFWGC